MVVDKELAEKKLFWKTLFETKLLASKMVSIAKNQAGSETYDLAQFGKVHLKVEPASTIGDNFMSDTFTVTACVTPGLHDKSTIYKTFIKVLPSNLRLRQAAFESRSHHREIQMYNSFFDHLRTLDPTHQVPLDVPDAYYVHLEEMVEGGADGMGTCIILEDLKSQGYIMSDKAVGADYQHCHLVLTSLAHYHAHTITALRQWTDPATGQFTNIPSDALFILENTIYESGGVQLVKNWGAGIVEFARDIHRPDLADWLADHVARVEDLLPIDDVKSCGPLACFVHGDFWNNNMLYRYETVDQSNQKEKEKRVPVALKLVDFQASRLGTPFADILYFLYSSATPETRENHMQELLRQYYDTLMNDLQLLGVDMDGYTFNNFLVEYKKRSVGLFFVGAMALTLVLNKEVATELEDLDKVKQAQGSETNNQPEKGASGMSAEVEETVMGLLGTQKLSKNKTLSQRLLRLILEVKALNS